MVTIYYSIATNSGNIIMHNPNPYATENHRRTYIGYSLKEAKRRFKDLLGITTRVHWEEV